MNIRRGLFRLWIVVSAVWVLGIGILWYQYSFAFRQTQIANIDECGKSYPPVPAPATALVRFNAMLNAQEHHPNCVPDVETVSFADFLVMHEPDREAVRQRFENAMRSEAQHAVAIGAGVPAGLLAFGLIVGWIVRGFRKDHPR
jgi:hypothetical protein